MSDTNLDFVIRALRNRGVIVEKRVDSIIYFTLKYKDFDDVHVTAVDDSDAFSLLTIVYLTASCWGVFQ